VNTRDGGICGYYNRRTSDGDIVVFNQDGSTVGRIGTIVGDGSTYFNSANTGIGLGASSVFPMDGDLDLGADATKDLGYSGGRWKDLYLSNAIYLGSGSGTTTSYISDYQDDLYIFNKEASGHIIYGTSNTERMRLTSAGNVSISGATAPETHAYLNIGSAGSGQTRAIDIDGGWSTNESKAISFTYGTGSANMVGQWDVQHNGPETRMRWGKLYHAADSSTYTMELVSKSTTAADLIVSGNIETTALELGYSTYNQAINSKSNYLLLQRDEAFPIQLWGTVVESRKDHYFGGSSSTANASITAAGVLTAVSKSFVIDHPTKEGMKLRHGSLEGPEDGVYVRGRLTGETVIELPDYWTGLVHEDSITVQLTAMGGKADLWVESIANNKVTVGCDTEVDCFYFVQATRKDVDAWDVEYVADS